MKKPDARAAIVYWWTHCRRGACAFLIRRFSYFTPRRHMIRDRLVVYPLSISSAWWIANALVRKSQAAYPTSYRVFICTAKILPRQPRFSVKVMQIFQLSAVAAILCSAWGYADGDVARRYRDSQDEVPRRYRRFAAA